MYDEAKTHIENLVACPICGGRVSGFKHGHGSIIRCVTPPNDNPMRRGCGLRYESLDKPVEQLAHEWNLSMSYMQ